MSITETEQIKLYLEFVQLKERAIEIKGKLKDTHFWKVVNPDESKTKVKAGSGVAKKPRKKKLEGEEKKEEKKKRAPKKKKIEETTTA
jgi:hypothetical protein